MKVRLNATLQNCISSVIDLYQFRSNISYASLLSELPVPVVTVSESQTMDHTHVVMRHDVDHSFINALMMANIEYRYGIRSTYYLLPPAIGKNYFGSYKLNDLQINQDVIVGSLYLQDLGHEVGLHNDLITMALLNKRPPEEFLEQIVNIFRKSGIRLVSSASHGAPQCREFGYVNYEIFKEFWSGSSQLKAKDPEQSKHMEIPFGTLSMQDYGFKSEAYHISYDAYYSDSGGNNTYSVKGQARDIPQDTTHFFTEDLLNIRCLQMLIHPDHWSSLLNDTSHYKDVMLKGQEKIYVNKALQERKYIIQNSSAVIDTQSDDFDMQSSYNISYARNKVHFEQSTELVNFVKSCLQELEPGPVLEVGCGQGDFLHRCVADLPPGVPVFGIDLAFAGIADCAIKYPQYSWVVYDVPAYFDKLLDEQQGAGNVPQRFRCIIDKTGITGVDDFASAYSLHKKIYETLEDGGCYIYIASTVFYARRYADASKWPMTWLDVLTKVYGKPRVYDTGEYYLRVHIKGA